MKIFKNKEYLIRRYLLLVVSLFWLSCEEDSTVDYKESNAIEQQVVDPYVQVTTPVVGFQAGTESYDYAFNVINGVIALKEVKVYSIFTDAATGMESNEVLFKTFAIEESNRNVIADNVNYADLKAGLTVNGAPLPDVDTDLKIGSGWRFRFEGVTTSGNTLRLPGAINLAVLSPYAGIYKVKEGTYERFDGITQDYTGQTRFIGSVDEVTFSYNDYWGSFSWAGKKFNFSVDLTTYEVYGPILVDGLFSGSSVLRCGENNFTIFSCEDSNVLIPDPLNPTSASGKHTIILTYGYVGPGGNREFYEVLEKVVD